MPFVGLTGGIGAGKSEALAALERLGAATLSTDAVVHELYATDEVRDAVVERWGDEVAPDGAVDRAAVAAARLRDPTTTAPGSRSCCGRASARAIARLARRRSSARDPRRRRPWSRCRCCSRPAWTAPSTRPSRSSPTRRCARARRPRAATRRVDERAARQLTQEEKAAARDFAVATPGPLEELQRKLSAILEKLSA